jgi:hypothetical protein
MTDYRRVKVASASAMTESQVWNWILALNTNLLARWERLSSEIECPSDESAGGFEHLVRLIGMRGVATACQDE